LGSFAEPRMRPGILLLLLLPAFGTQTVQAANNRSLCMFHMRQIGVACEGYRQEYGKFPTDIYDANGNALLSWRVRLLPFLEGDRLYKEFHLDEPWDSPHNRQLIAKIPRTCMCATWAHQDGWTAYLIPRGPGTILPPGEERGWGTIPGDGSATIVLIEADN